jgi:hypothetical protein
MNINQPLQPGTRLKYSGRPFDGFDNTDPFMIFMGYDSGGFCDIWVNYKNNTICISVSDAEIEEQVVANGEDFS